MHSTTVYIVIALLTFGIFSGVNLHEFVDYGDQQTIVHNDLVTNGLADGGAARAFAVTPGEAWQPLAWLSLQAQYDRGGVIIPAPYMFGNLALHIAATLLWLLALSKLTGRMWPSAFVAAVYAVHPLAVEGVAWASARPDTLSHVFFAASVAAWAFYVERPGRGRYAALLACVALGVLSGGSFAALPFALLVLDVWPLGRLRFAGVRAGRFADQPEKSASVLLAEKAPLLLLGIVSAVLGRTSEVGVVNTWGSDPGLFVRAELVLLNVFDALGRMLWPNDLAFTAPSALQSGLTTIPIWQAALALVLIAAITFVIVRLGESGRPALAGWLWFLVLTVPVAGFIPTGLRMMHDRQLQLPLIGIALAVAFCGERLLARVPRREIVASVLAAAVLVPLAATARVQVATWRDSDALFDHALAVHDRDALALYYKAMRLASRGFDSAALAQLERAVEIHPAQIHANLALGQMQLQHREPEAALSSLRRAEVGMPDSAFVRVFVAAALMDLDRVDDAFAAIEEAIVLDPEYSGAYLQRARFRLRLGRADAALADYRRTLELNPVDGTARVEMKQLERALRGDAPAS